ncbi:MAG: hypothetical protein LJE95_10700 [Acidobacteria bacterium]|jgi:hypothetical protein|nr:hypothetical protein [Acidobacteriota bacterium]
MTTQNTSQPIQEHAAASSSPSPFTVLGWTLLCFALIPLTMAAHATGHGYIIVGGGLAAISIVCIVLGKIMGKRRGGKATT